MSHWKQRSRAASFHMLASVLVALLAAGLVFSIWYPYPYRNASGGRTLFLLLVTVDVIVGPLLTFAVFNRSKPAAELRRDLVIVVLLQLAALGYGMWTVYMARPVHLAFEIDRFRVVHAIEVDPGLLQKAPHGLDRLPLMGVEPVAVRQFKSVTEGGEATLAALAGVSLAARPDLWEPYALAKERVRARAKPAAALRQRFPQQSGLIDAAIAASGRPLASLAYLPMSSRMQFWTVLLDSQTMDVVGFIELDSF